MEGSQNHMKKLAKKLPFKRGKQSAPPSRITNDTVAEHRERILSGGKRFKYPLQYTRHKLVINAIIIAVVAVVGLTALGWWQLYIAHNSSAFFHRITQIAPLPIGRVDGEYARYSDYLLNYRSSEHYLSNYDEIRLDSDDGKLQLQYKKREALDIALQDAFARKIADERELSVDQDQVDTVLQSLRNAANGQLSEETSAASSQRVLGLDKAGLETLVRNSLLRSEAAFAVDEQAKTRAETAERFIERRDGDLEQVAADMNKEAEGSAEYGISGLVSTSLTVGGIRAADVAKLERGNVSTLMRSVTSDGYYFVKVMEKNDTQVSFSYVRIPLTEFMRQFTQLREADKIDEYITITIDQPETTEEE